MGDYNGQIYGEIVAARQAQILAAQNNQAREKASRISKVGVVTMTFNHFFVMTFFN